MMMPPTADSLSKNVDPSKRPRQFRSGKGASSGGGGGGMDSSWTETPEEKRKRLQDQVLGVAAALGSKTTSENPRSKQDEEAARRIREHNVSSNFSPDTKLTMLIFTRRNIEASHCLSSIREERMSRKTMTQASEPSTARKTLGEYSSESRNRRR